MIKVGTKVRVVAPVIEGEVKKLVPVEDGTELTYLVEYPDANGNLQQRTFSEDQLAPTSD